VRRQGRRRWERQGVAVSFVCAIARPRLGLEGSVHREGDGREDDVGAARRSARRRGVWARSDVEAGGGSGDEESGARSDVEAGSGSCDEEAVQGRTWRREVDPATRRLGKDRTRVVPAARGGVRVWRIIVRSW
jgi:hypothetical protein